MRRLGCCSCWLTNRRPFPSGPEPQVQWIAYTPDGHYDGSADIGKYLRWRVGDSMHPAAEFEAQFHRPDLVQKALTGE